MGALAGAWKMAELRRTSFSLGEGGGEEAEVDGGRAGRRRGNYGGWGGVGEVGRRRGTRWRKKTTEVEQNIRHLIRIHTLNINNVFV